MEQVVAAADRVDGMAILKAEELHALRVLGRQVAFGDRASVTRWDFHNRRRISRHGDFPGEQVAMVTPMAADWTVGRVEVRLGPGELAHAVRFEFDLLEPWS